MVGNTSKKRGREHPGPVQPIGRPPFQAKSTDLRNVREFVDEVEEPQSFRVITRGSTEEDE